MISRLKLILFPRNLDDNTDPWLLLWHKDSSNAWQESFGLDSLTPAGTHRTTGKQVGEIGAKKGGI